MEQTENKIQPEGQEKDHHVIVRAWLTLLLILSLITAVIYFNIGLEIEKIAIAVLSISCAFFILLLFDFKKVGFFGYIPAKLVNIGILVYLGNLDILSNIVGPILNLTNKK